MTPYTDKDKAVALAYFKRMNVVFEKYYITVCQDTYLDLHARLLPCIQEFETLSPKGNCSLRFNQFADRDNFEFFMRDSFTGHEAMGLKSYLGETHFKTIKEQGQAFSQSIHDMFFGHFPAIELIMSVRESQSSRVSYHLHLNNDALIFNDVHCAGRFVCLFYAFKQAVFLNGRKREDLPSAEKLLGPAMVKDPETQTKSPKLCLGTDEQDRKRIYAKLSIVLAQLVHADDNVF